MGCTLISFVIPVVAGLSTARAEQADGSLPRGPGLLVAPPRIVFEGRLRNAEIALVNQSSEVATYRISLVHYRMTETGALEEVEEQVKDLFYADRLLRFSPRQVTLEPRVAQTVRIQVRKPADLEVGEYRSHLLFRHVPPEDVGRQVESEPATSTGFRVRLIPIYGISVPVIVRHGKTSAVVRLSELELHPAGAPGEPPHVSLALQRSGNRSVYANLRVQFVPDKGRPVLVGLAKGVAVYTPNRIRSFRLPLSQWPSGRRLGPGKLRVSYGLDEEEPLATGEIALR